MREINERIFIPEELFLSFKQRFPKKTDEQNRGFALDALERKHYTEVFGWKTSPSEFSPFDVECSEIFADFKLCSKRTVTLSAAETFFGYNNSYLILIYTLESPTIAVFRGGVIFDELKDYLKESKKNDGSMYAWLHHLERYISK